MMHGTPVALGTDSLASNPDLDVLAEARCIHEIHPDFDTEILLRLATLSGATALEMNHVTGSLIPGKSADFLVLPLPKDEPTDPHLLIFESDMSVKEVYFRGKSI